MTHVECLWNQSSQCGVCTDHHGAADVLPAADGWPMNAGSDVFFWKWPPAVPAWCAIRAVFAGLWIPSFARLLLARRFVGLTVVWSTLATHHAWLMQAKWVAPLELYFVRFRNNWFLWFWKVMLTSISKLAPQNMLVVANLLKHISYTIAYVCMYVCLKPVYWLMLNV